MNNHLKSSFTLLMLISFFIFVIASYLIYENEINNIKQDTKNKIFIHSNDLKEYISISKSLIYSLKNSVETSLELSLHSTIHHPAYEDIKFKKEKDLYYITNTYSSNINNILIGTGKINDFDYDKKDEIYAALYLTPLFNTVLHIIPETKWVYYTSKNEFIYISPSCDINLFNSFKRYYNAPFWKSAIPENNPEKKLKISNLYKDEAGKDLMISLSAPVFTNDSFKGVVSIDIGLDILNKYLKNEHILGDLYLVNKENYILAATSSFDLTEKLIYSPKNSVKIEITKNELYLINIQNSNQIKLKAFRNALWKILILFLILNLTIIVFYLKKLLLKVEYIAKTDSLTKLLNRRTLESEIKSLINVSNRYKQDLSFLLIDIDFFKKINDTYGHQIGDEVLIEISKLFIEKTRDYDVIGRYGGEEFFIALANTNINDAFILAERIRKNAKLIKIGKLNINLTISIGCTQLKENDTYFKILKRIDTLLYKAKGTGRDITVKEEEN